MYLLEEELEVIGVDTGGDAFTILANGYLDRTTLGVTYHDPDLLSTPSYRLQSPPPCASRPP